MASIKASLATYNTEPSQMLAMAEAAEEIGFTDIWMGEHYVIPGKRTSVHPGLHNDAVKNDESEVIGDDVRIDDPWFMLGAVSGATRSIHMGTAIIIAPLMHPLLLARASCTAWDMSSGRFRLGLGAGWMKEEFDAIGVPFNERGARLDEAIDILRAAWQGGHFDYQGKHYSVDDIQITPHATPVPLVFGGNSGPALRRVIARADYWMNSAMISLEDALRMRDEIERGRAAIGKAPLTYFIRPPSPEPELLDSFLREGFENLVIYAPMLWPRTSEIPIEEKVETLRQKAREIGITPSS